MGTTGEHTGPFASGLSPCAFRRNIGAFRRVSAAYRRVLAAYRPRILCVSLRILCVWVRILAYPCVSAVNSVRIRVLDPVGGLDGKNRKAPELLRIGELPLQTVI